MKKIITLLFAALLMTSTFATTKTPSKALRKIAQEEIKCGATIEDIINQIENTTGCAQAINIAKACAEASTGGASISRSAEAFCERDFKKMTKDDTSLKLKMFKRCERICNRTKDGSMCASSIATCRLSVSGYFSQLYNSDL